MADYFTQFSCILNVGSTENAARANDIRDELDAELDREEGATLGFAMTVDHETGAGALWLHSDEYGEPEHVITFVLRCAEALGLDGVWGFSWSHSCSRPRVDAFGGGAHVIDLGKRATIADIDCSNFIFEQTAAAARSTEEVLP